MRYLEPLATVALLLVALLACGKGSKSSDSSGAPAAGNSSAPAAGNSAAPAVEVPTVKASDLINDYKANELRADAKWKGRIVKVVGFVGDIKKDIAGSAYITIGMGGAIEFPRVQCSLADGQEQAAMNLSKGQGVAIKGRVSGLMMNVQVRDCEVIVTGDILPSAR